MKGMQKISRGSGFRGALDYCAKGGEKIGGNMTGATPRELASEFRLSREQKDCKKPVWHSSLRLPKGDTLSKEKWNEVATLYMSRMGFNEDHQFAVFLHDDPRGQHIHVVASRVSLSGKIFYGQNENLISTQIIHELEKRFSLTPTTGADSAPPKKRRTPKKPEIEKSLRSLVKPPRIALAEVVDKCLSTDRPKNPESLKTALAVRGVETEFFEKDGKIAGVTFVLNGLRFSGSALGPDYKWPKISERMADDKTRPDQKLADAGRDGATHPVDKNPERQNQGLRKKGLRPRTGRRATKDENKTFQDFLKREKTMENQKMIGGLTYRKRTPSPVDPDNLNHGWVEFTDRGSKVWFYPDDEPPRPGNLSGYSWQPPTETHPASICAYDTAISKVGLEQAARDCVRIAVFKGLPEPVSTHGSDEFRKAVAREMFKMNIELADLDGPAKQEYDRLHKSKHEELEKSRLAQVNSISAAFQGIDDQAKVARRATLARAADMEDTPSKKDDDHRMRMGPRQ